jgi:hypothetical protein
MQILSILQKEGPNCSVPQFQTFRNSVIALCRKNRHCFPSECQVQYVHLFGTQLFNLEPILFDFLFGIACQLTTDAVYALIALFRDDMLTSVRQANCLEFPASEPIVPTVRFVSVSKGTFGFVRDGGLIDGFHPSQTFRFRELVDLVALNNEPIRLKLLTVSQLICDNLSHIERFFAAFFEVLSLQINSSYRIHIFRLILLTATEINRLRDCRFAFSQGIPLNFFIRQYSIRTLRSSITT